MKNLGTLIYTNAWEYQVYAVVTRDISSTRVSVDIYVLNPKEEMSDIITIPRKDIKDAKKKWWNFFYDLEGDFTRDDVDTIKDEILKISNDFQNASLSQNKATMKEIHKAVSDYIVENAEDLEINSCPDVFIKDKVGFMTTSRMDEFVLNNKSLGFKRLDILKRLKIMGALQPENTRPYDVLITIGGEKKRYYRIELLEVTEEEEAISL